MTARRPTILSILCFLAVFPVVANTAGPSDGAADFEWRATMVAVSAGEESVPVVLDPESTRLVADLLGPVVRGKLVQEYVNDGPVPLQTQHRTTAPARLKVVKTLTPADAKVRPGSPRAQRTGGATGRAPNMTPNQAVVVQPGGRTTVEHEFELIATFVDGRYHVRLPSVATDDGKDARALPVEILLRVHHGEPLLIAESPTHEIFVSYEGNLSRIELVEGVTAGRPFELEIAMGKQEDEADLSGYAGEEDEHGNREVMVVLSPPVRPDDGTIRPKQVLFVIDSSGSMAGEKIAEARAALALCLDGIREHDQLYAVKFNSVFEEMSAEPLDGSVAVDQAHAWLQGLRAGGGTHLMPALEAALEQPERSDLHRMVVILTDGALADRDPALALLKQRLGNARLFVVGIGKDVQEATIRSLAEFGRGTAAFARNPEELKSAVTTLFDSVSAPLAWDLEIDWQGAQVTEVRPNPLPDLYAGRPVTVFARVNGHVPHELNVTAETVDGPMTFTTPIAGSDSDR